MVQTVTIFSTATRLNLTLSSCVMLQGTGSPSELSYCTCARSVLAPFLGEPTSRKSSVLSCLHRASAPATGPFIGLVSTESIINLQLTFSLMIISIRCYTANIFRARVSDNKSYFFFRLTQMRKIFYPTLLQSILLE